jgi:hypothetical protein
MTKRGTTDSPNDGAIAVGLCDSRHAVDGRELVDAAAQPIRGDDDVRVNESNPPRVRSTLPNSPSRSSAEVDIVTKQTQVCVALGYLFDNSYG